MAQDTALLRYLLKGARRAPGSGSQRDLAFAFGGTNDYISSNATIGRTGYDMNVSGNVSTGSDGDGSYFWINGNRDATAGTGTRAEFNSATTPTFTQATDITIKARVKLKSFAATDTAGIFGPRFVFCMSSASPNQIRFTVRGSSSVDVNVASSLNTLYDLYMVWVAADAKFYYYVNGVLQNVGGTAGPATWTTVGTSVVVGDNAIGSGNSSSGEKYIYHAAIRNKALTQAEINADIALGNTTKNDPSIVAYYIPENLQYNTQYIANPKALDQSPRSYTGATVTANTDVAPDGTTTADNIVFGAATHRLVQQKITAVTGSSLASKTIIIKAFVKCTAATQTFRFRMDHAGVDTNKYSSDFTATTTWQEFTFTRTLTSSTSGTGLFCSVANNAGGTAQTIQVRNVRCYLVNETLRDESPNIGGYIGRKTNTVLSVWIKPGADAVNGGDSQSIIQIPYLYIHLRDTTNLINVRTDTRQAARAPGTMALGNGYRGKVHIIGYKYRDGSVWRMKLYINGVLQLGTQTVITVDPAVVIYGTVAWCGRRNGTYYNGNIRDARIYTLTDSFTNADALAIYNGGEPTSSGVTKYLHYKPPVGEVGTTTQDQSTNDRDGTLNGGVTRNYI